MDTFNPSKRQVSTYEKFLKDREKAEKAKHIEKGEADIVKKSMDGEVEGKKGYEVLDEALLSEDKKRLEEAVEKAGEAFWAVIAESYPEIKSGDFPPDATFAFDNAQEKAVKTWLGFNGYKSSYFTKTN
jgi:hypothetical protein